MNWHSILQEAASTAITVLVPILITVAIAVLQRIAVHFKLQINQQQLDALQKVLVGGISYAEEADAASRKAGKGGLSSNQKLQAATSFAVGQIKNADPDKIREQIQSILPSVDGAGAASVKSAGGQS